MGEVSPAFGCRHRGNSSSRGLCGCQRLGYAWLPYFAVALHRTCSWLHNRYCGRLAMAQTGLCCICTELCFYGGTPTAGSCRSHFTDWHGNLGARSMYDIPSKESVISAFEEGAYTVDNNDLIGYDRGQLREIWGEPDSMLSGFWGDRWEVDDSTNVIVYYAADEKIEYVKIDTDSAYDNNRAAATIDGEVYYVVGDPIYFESEEIESMTFLEHAVPYIESKPEAGYYDPDLEMKYAKVDEGIVVLYMTEWYLCVPADTAISD